MGLEKIEIENFKSYKGRYSIGPLDRLSCIIGPNGSGKSNIMDAVIFAFGVRSNNLRLSKIRGVIHDLCDYCSVEITINGNKFQRQLNKNGKSAYFYDGVGISYEEYAQKLESINIFLDIRNFMIFQGEVGNIANKSPIEFTKMIERVSGSDKLVGEYDRLNKLQNDLVNQCMIVFEKRKEFMNVVKENKEQKESEKMFKKYLKNKGLIEKRIFNCEVADRRRKLLQLQGQIQAYNEQNNTQIGEIRIVEGDIENKKQGMLNIQGEYYKLEEDLRKLKEERDLYNYKLVNLYRSRDLNDIQKKTIENMLSENIKTREKIITDIDSEKQQLNQLISAYSLLVENYDYIKQSEQVNPAKLQEIMALSEEYENSVAEYKERLDEIEIDLFPKQATINSIQARILKLETLNKKLKNNIDESNKTLESINLQISKFLNYINELNEKEEKSLKEYNALLDEEKDIKNEVMALTSKILEVKASTRISNRSVILRSTVETLKTIFPGVVGCTIDIIKPTQKKYETPLSVILSPYENSVIVDNDMTAISCINYIKEKRLCKISFLPIDSLKIKEAQLFNSERYRSTLYTVDYDKKYQKILSFVLGNSIIADDLNTARDLVYVKNIKHNVSTLEGVIFSSRGRLITCHKQVSNKFENVEISDMISKRKSLIDALKIIEDKKYSLAHVDLIKERIEDWNRKVEEKENEKIDLNNKIYLDKVALNSNVEKIKSLTEELESIKKDVDLFALEKQETLTFMAEQERIIFKDKFIGTPFKDYKEFKNKTSDDFLNNKTLEFNSAKQTKEIKIKALSEELKELDSKINDLQQRLVNNVNGIDNIEDEAKHLDDRIQSLITQVDIRRQEYNRYKDSLKILSRALENLFEHKKSPDNNILNLTSKRDRILDEINDLVKFAVIEEYCKDLAGNDNITLEAIERLNIGEDVDDIGELKKELHEINKKIDELTPYLQADKKSINMSSYDRINDEYSRLKIETTNAREMFDSVKNERSRLFMDCFNVISQEVSRLYKEITKSDNMEGSAYLVLENHTEPYKDGVKYHVMPPNKRFREIEFLSGGEKTMAVFALILSIFKYKPAPFFMLDEMDAALDKLNIKKVIDFFVKAEHQFIIISHKPQLFQHADSLIGVYKDPFENNSRILTYKLKE